MVVPSPLQISCIRIRVGGELQTNHILTLTLTLPCLYVSMPPQWATAITAISNSALAVPSGADSMGHGGHVPRLLQWIATEDTMSRRTANKKLTKLY